MILPSRGHLARSQVGVDVIGISGQEARDTQDGNTSVNSYPSLPPGG